MTKSILILTFCLVLTNFTFAQSLDSLIISAIDENLELKILEKEYLAALEKAAQVSQLSDPVIGLGVFPLPVETRLGAQLMRLSATQMLPWKGSLEGKKKIELSKAEALFPKIRAQAMEIKFQIEQAYFLLYEIEKSQEIITRNLSLLSSLEKLALAKVAGGTASSADVLRVQLKTEELIQEIGILEIAKAKPRATINQLLNRPVESQVDMQDSFSLAMLPSDKKSLITKVTDDHPNLHILDLQQRVAQNSIELNGLNNKPSFGLGMDYIMVNQRSDADPIHNGRDIIQLRASVKVPIYKQKYSAKDREEQLKIAALSDRRNDLINRMTAFIEQAYADHETAHLRAALYTQQIEITKATIKILQTKYSSTGTGFDELLQMERELIAYDLKILKAIVQSHLAKNRIERYVPSSLNTKKIN